MAEIDETITPQMLLGAYCQGFFPMADGRRGELGWYSPDPRALQPFLEDDPLGAFHVRRSLAKFLRGDPPEITTDRCFADVIEACAVPRSEDDETWISPLIEQLFTELHHMGFAHSIEAWRGKELVGGLYGLAIGGAFFAESMYSREPYASQACYAWLVDHLRERGYTLLDVQFVNPHLEQFGVVELPRDRYLEMLGQALCESRSWLS